METAKEKKFKGIAAGDIVWMKPTGNAARRGLTELLEGKVTKVGREYFYVSRVFDDGSLSRYVEKIRIEDGECINEGNYGYIIYRSKEEAAEDNDKEEKYEEIRKFFSSYGGNVKKLSYGAIKDIHAILRKEGVL